MNTMITKVRHIGVVVNDVEKSIGIFKNLFDVKDEDIQFVDMGVECRFAFIPVAGIKLELIQPISERFKEMLGNPVEGINHIGFEARDIEELVRLLEKKGFRPGHVTKKGVMKMGRSKVVYLDPETTGGILIELVEPME